VQTITNQNNDIGVIVIIKGIESDVLCTKVYQNYSRMKKGP
jgi:hypothetical protein